MTKVEMSQATLSECGLYRYDLTRRWDRDKPMVLFVMLNPSTADHRENDATIRRCIGFAKLWGFGGLVVVNLFAFRATDPKRLKGVEDPVGPLNKDYLYKHVHECAQVVCAWGNGGELFARGFYVGEILKPFDPQCLGKTKRGYPRHPLRLRSDTRLEPLFAGSHG